MPGRRCKVILDGCSLTCQSLTALGKHGSSIAVAENAWNKVTRVGDVIHWSIKVASYTYIPTHIKGSG